MPVNVYCDRVAHHSKDLNEFWPASVQGAGLDNLRNKQCKPCEGGICPLDERQSVLHLDQLPGWELAEDKISIVRTLRFKDFLETISFINAMAYMSEQQGHHPDFSAGYNYCEVRYTTHAIGGLSENDFICAAKINKLLEP
jgi:4a-hydroxytetrahydrobiopterin dehydratase